MQPNDQQGYYNPDPNQPPVGGQPQVPQTPVVGQQPMVQPVPQPIVQPIQQQPVQPINPAVMQAQLEQPGLQQPQSYAPQDPQIQQPVDDEGYDEEYDDELNDEPVSWTAHEYIHQEKGGLWYTVFGLLIVVGVGLTIWLQQWTFLAVLVVIAVVIIVNSKRPPRDLTYVLNGDGLSIDGKLHKFEDFKSFGVIQDREHFSVMLIPTQRFQPSVSVYFPEESGEMIVDVLGSRLPMKDLKLDAVDHVVRWLKL